MSIFEQMVVVPTVTSCDHLIQISAAGAFAVVEWLMCVCGGGGGGAETSFRVWVGLRGQSPLV